MQKKYIKSKFKINSENLKNPKIERFVIKRMKIFKA